MSDQAQFRIEEATSGAASGGLQRSMGLVGTLFITVSCLSPSIAVFIVASDVIRQVGTGVFLCFSAAALFGVTMACVYGELGSALPSAGGEYTIISQVLGARWGKGVLGLNLLGFGISLALSGFAVATYLDAVWPALPARPVAALAVAIVTCLATLNIKVSALVTGGFLLVELLALTILTVLGALHAHAPVSVLVNPVVAQTSGGLAAAGLAAMGVGTAAGIYAFNGYGAAIFFGEDMRDGRRDIPPVVFLALFTGIVMIMPPIVFVILGAPDLRSLFLAPAPLSAFVEQLGGTGLARVMSLGVALAVFNTMIAIALMAGRQLYATGRDGLWPAPVSKALSATHPRWGSPWAATLSMGAFGLLSCLLDPHALVLILGNSNIVTYSGLCLASLRMRRIGQATGWRMPLFPAAPVLGLTFLLMVVIIDLFDSGGRGGLLITVLTFVAALILFARAGRKGRVTLPVQGTSARPSPRRRDAP